MSKIFLQQEPVVSEPIFKERVYFRTGQGANNFQATYQWRDPSDQVRSFLITLSAFPKRTVGRIAVFSIDASQWSFLHDEYGEALKVSKLAEKRPEEIGTWKEQMFLMKETVLDYVLDDEEKLLAYAKMLYGG